MKEEITMKVSSYLSNESIYCSEKPYNPPQIFPELSFLQSHQICPTNSVYTAIRESLLMIGLDNHRYGTKNWNPLGELIKPGDRVVLKPNLVMHHRPSVVNDKDSITTHGSVIRAAIDYVFLALEGSGEIIIADTPLQSANFDRLVRETGLDAIQEFYQRSFGKQIEVLDLRNEWAVTDDKSAYISERKHLQGDPNGHYEIDLGDQSELFEITAKRTDFSVQDYDDSVTCEKHTLNVHKYLFSGTILGADVVINLPKLKTHQKAGITCALKNCIGMNVSKDYLPHFRSGSPEIGGDEYPRKSYYNSIVSKYRKGFQNRLPISLWKLARKSAFVFQDHVLTKLPTRSDLPSCAIHGGAWYGNDTIWRTILDLNKILLYADQNGVLQNNIQRKCFSIVDGIVAGEGEGPLKSTPKCCGLVACGEDPVAVDLVCARLMGFDESKIPQLKNSHGLRRFPITSYNGDFEDIEWLRNKPLEQFLQEHRSFHFKPPVGWVGHIERSVL